MFEALFGAEMPLAMRFFVAFLIVFGLAAAILWAVRRFGVGGIGTAGLRGRQPRLAVIDYANVDARRRLILVRRDNVEHLLMIGGPTDVVVEANIARGTQAVRESAAPARLPAAAEPLPRALPLPESGAWPLAPEPIAPARPMPRLEPEPEEHPLPSAAHYTETSSRPPRETLAALAEEIAARPAPPRVRPAAAPRPHAAEPRLEPRPEPRMQPMAPADGDADDADQNLAEMAHRLEAALRKPKPAAEAAEEEAPTVAPRARPARSGEARLPRAEAKAGQGKAFYDSLEQEMASLLGRPAGRT